ncbi:MAG TPA: hypothetical protein VH025_04700 [Solirubrobacteraceae bacterium]|jgi:hypothetical protein|nr:hypothetical protein [Solirubrobacteraceae bacterium]
MTAQAGLAGGAEDIAVESLLETGAVLASSLDLARTFAHVAELTVPRLADLCVIDLLGDDGAIRRMRLEDSSSGTDER